MSSGCHHAGRLSRLGRQLHDAERDLDLLAGDLIVVEGDFEDGLDSALGIGHCPLKSGA
jgi:hypothetical protein